MTAILPPPRSRLTQNLTLAWLRLGKAAVFSVLAGLAVAGGVLFSGGEAAAQGYGGYTYTSRVCQEYGQQPRYYNVRDGQAAYNGGNSDSGWLLVLERGAGTLTVFSQRTFIGGAAPLIEVATPRREKIRLTDSSGLTGFAIYIADGSRPGNLVIDQNNDGEITVAGDRTAGPTGDAFEYYQRYTSQAYGGSYVRWAHIAWCR